ncbi:MAG: EAL domain-containing protein [Acetobacter sp.]|uniref:putative bifunctional diguanylate cyclase/phosphodiesterase n=1 Tax=Acetobacter sp. TaxID=440 RepID=UPI0039E9AB3B
MVALHVTSLPIVGWSVTPYVTYVLAIAIIGIVLVIIGSGFAGYLFETSVRAEAVSRLHRIGMRDTLTGLSSRAAFCAELDLRMATPGNPVGLLVIDLDGFKLANDTYGYRLGDTLLTQVARRLREVCKTSVTLVGRLDGDEFAVLLPHDSEQEVELLAAQIIAALGKPYDVDCDLNIRIAASIGIALAPLHGETGGALLSHAEMALDSAKAAGTGMSRMFLPEMKARIQECIYLDTKLRDTLKSGAGLFVFYQPIVAIETGAVIAREALVRWYLPTRGWISPSEFVPMAEQTGLIEQLGTFVIETACHDAAGWTDGARVAVNVSVSQLGNGTLVPLVRKTLALSGLLSERLEVEVTETALVDNEQEIIEELRQLRLLGVRVALDDFGTGYSSLAHLRAFPFDKIKIDSSFVRDAVKRSDCAAVVQAVATLGLHLGVDTVAEGVETQAQLDCAREAGCSQVQGYLFGRPAPEKRDFHLVDEINRGAREFVRRTNDETESVELS